MDVKLVGQWKRPDRGGVGVSFRLKLDGSSKRVEVTICLTTEFIQFHTGCEGSDEQKTKAGINIVAYELGLLTELPAQTNFIRDSVELKPMVSC